MLDMMDVLDKVRALPEDHYNLIMNVMDSRRAEGAKLSAEAVMELLRTPKEELEAELDAADSLQENMLRTIVREAYEAACMECGYEEGLEECGYEEESVQSKDMAHRKDAMGMEEALEEYLAEAKKNWIAQAVKHPGALHKTAEKKGLAKKGEPLSQTDLDKLEAMGGKTAKRARLARTLKGLKK